MKLYMNIYLEKDMNIIINVKIYHVKNYLINN